VKEDDPCPGQTTGTIPNNKSDLRYFGVYQEAGPVASDPGFLHLFWTRVSEPSGAILMDFEFNKSKTKCTTNGSPNVLRTAGDLLIEYKIEGGEDTTPDITIRRWVGNATSGQWGTATPLPPADAIGAINLSPISNPTGPTDRSDGTLPDGTTSENRTFGEASIDLSAIFDPAKCESFGSAMLKSRAGPPFESQIKDFIAPDTGINIQNFAKVIIRKETLPDEQTPTTEFTYTHNLKTDPAQPADDPNTVGFNESTQFKLKDDGVKDFGTTVIFGTGLTVEETGMPAGGWTLKTLDCSASSTSVPAADRVVSGAKVTFTLDSATDVLDCTYTNEKPEGALLIKKQSTKQVNGVNQLVKNAGAVFSYDDTDANTQVNLRTVTDDITSAAPDEDADKGEVCVDGLTPGEYNVNEDTPPNGYGDASQLDQKVTVVGGTDCDVPAPPASDPIPGPGTGATVTFTNPPLADIQVNFRDGGSGETSVDPPTGELSCTGAGTTASTTPATGWDDSVTHTGISIDPSPKTITCTIIIDP
jgi:hypothetical protein